MNFRIGAKFVRGAYMDLERRLAREQVTHVRLRSNSDNCTIEHQNLVQLSDQNFL